MGSHASVILRTKYSLMKNIIDKAIIGGNITNLFTKTSIKSEKNPRTQ